MQILDWFLRRAAGDADPAPPFPPSVGSLPLPDADPEEEASEAFAKCEETQSAYRGIELRPALAFEDLEPIYVILDYIDSRGNYSRRRVTFIRLKAGPEAPLLQAICHERSKLRSFRTDRIQSVIDAETGEVSTASRFFEEFLEISLDDWFIQRRSPTSLASKQIERCRTALRAPISVLLAAAKSDSTVHPEEIDVIQRYAEAELFDLSRREPGLRTISLETVDAFNKTIPKMRPRQAAMQDCFIEISRFPPERLARFVDAAEQIVMADGKLEMEEIMFVSELTETLASLRRSHNAA